MPETKIQRVGSYAFITAENHVLLSLLNRGPNRGKWTLVGGGVEFAEDPKDTVIREIEEEAGIKVTVEPLLLGVLSHHYRFAEPDGEEKNMHFIGIVHTLELPKRLPCKVDSDGFSSDGTQWFNLEGLDETQLNPSVVKVLRMIEARNCVSK